MKVDETKTVDLGGGHKIEFGKASWDNTKTSIRNRYPTSTGGFSPRSSSEIPIDDLPILIKEALKKGYINAKEIKTIIKVAVDNL